MQLGEISDYTWSTGIGDDVGNSVSMQHWTKLEISGDKPLARDCHTSCCIAVPSTGQEEQHSLLMVVGGYGGDGALCDVWLLDVDKGLWSEVSMHALLN